MEGFLLSYNKSYGIWPISNQVAIQRGQVTAHGDLPSFLIILRFFAFAGIIPFQNLCVFTQDAHVEFLVSIPVIKGKKPKDSLCLVICT